MEIKSVKQAFSCPAIICWFVSIIMCGAFHEFTSGIIAAAMGVILFFISKTEKEINICLSLESISVFVVLLFYLLTAFWAVDKSMAVFGFVKFLPAGLFLIYAMQKKDFKNSLIEIIPIVGVFMTVISAILMQIPFLEKYFAVSGRLAGFFQYPNTFALFNLLGLIAILTNNKFSIKNIIFSAVLLFGIVYSGSRTAAVLTLLFVIILVALNKNKKIRYTFLGVFALIIIAAVIYAGVTDNYRSIGRFLTTSLSESTFVGRLLYFKDGIKIILKNPFGLGYMGYYYNQGYYQTGVYSVQYIHNDLLQLMLDIGIAPTVLLIAGLVKTVFSKKTSLVCRLMIFAICMHAMFDFDLQFVSITILLVCLMNVDDGKEITIKHSAAAVAGTVLCSVLCMYFSAVSAFSFFNMHEMCLKLYPSYTISQLSLLNSKNTIEEQTEIADKILNHNKCVSIAYSAKARKAFSDGKILEMIELKEKAIDYAPYVIEEYNDYAKMLLHSLSLYNANGDINSVDFCTKRLIMLENRLKDLEQNTDKLALKITDKPVFTLDEELAAAIYDVKNLYLKNNKLN